VPEDHPLRAIRLLVNAALDRLSPAFASIYADTGRPSIPPEKLLRALLLQALFTIRSERQLMQQITHKEIGRWRGDLDLAAGGAGRSARWQKVLLAVRNMGGKSEAAWRSLFDGRDVIRTLTRSEAAAGVCIGLRDLCTGRQSEHRATSGG